MASFHTERLWVLIADGEHARVVTPVVAAGQFVTEVTFDSESALLRSSDMGSERPGRVHESASTTRHAITPRSDPHASAKHHFVSDVAKLIDEHALRHEFARLVLIAPASALHDLRAALGKAALGMVVGSLNKDLVKLTDHDLIPHLAEWWTAPASAAV